MNAPARAHALCSPSSAARWMSCAGSVAMEINEPDSESEAAADGTLSHAYAAQWLMAGRAPDELIKDLDRYDRVKLYVDCVMGAVGAYKQAGARTTLLVEQGLPLEDLTGERGAVGTGDAVIIAEFASHAIVHVLDLKDGYTTVEDTSPQLRIYALAAVRKHGLMLDIREAYTTVVQPKVNSEPVTLKWDVYTELEGGFADQVKQSAQFALSLVDNPAAALSHLVPSEKACKFCKAAKAVKCPAFNQHVHDTVFDETTEITDGSAQPVAEDNFVGSATDFQQRLLPLFMARVPLIEMWCGYVRERVASQLAQGHPVDDGNGCAFKLVLGRAGARKWSNTGPVLTTLAAHHVPRELAMEPAELKTPAALEKALKSAYPGVFDLLKPLVKQAPGGPAVAPMDDPRPAWAGNANSSEAEDYSADGLV